MNKKNITSDFVVCPSLYMFTKITAHIRVPLFFKKKWK